MNKRDNSKAPAASTEAPVTASGRKKSLSTAHGSITMMAMAILIVTDRKSVV